MRQAEISSACPTDEQLERYAADGASSAQTWDIAGHAENCDHCRGWLADASADEAVLAAIRAGLAVGGLRAETGTQASRAAQAGSPSGESIAFPGVVAGYRILRKLGEGGMGIVFEAEQENPRRTVALKLLKADVVSDATLRRFEHEAHILGMLQHPGIAQIFGAGTADLGFGPRPYFVMEFIRGQSLIEHVRNHALDTRERVELLAKVCDAVQYAHQKGIIHRDLKPRNVLVVDEREQGTGNREQTAGYAAQPKVLDFGVARVIDADLGMTTAHTEAGQLIGTLAYMSPEQVSGDPLRIDTRSDVYSLGVVGYELLSGRLPYALHGKPIHEAARTVAEQQPAPLSTADQRFDEDLEAIFGTALEKDPARRYASAAELAADLGRYLGHEPVLAHAPTRWYRMRKFARRNRVLVGGVAATMLALAVGLVLTTWQAVRAQRAEARAQERFKDVRKLANTLIFDLHDEIKDLPGSTAALKTLLERGLEYLDRLAAEAGNDPELQGELASAYERLGNRRASILASSIGESSAALESLHKALQLRESLHRRNPEVPEASLALAQIHHTIAATFWLQEDYRVAAQHLLAAWEITRDLCDEHPESCETLPERASWLNRVLKEDGRLEEAKRIAQETANRAASAPLAPPTTAEENLARGASFHMAVAGAFLFADEPQIALEHYALAQPFLARATELEPTNPQYAGAAGYGVRYQGLAHKALGNYARAIECGLESLAEQEAAYERRPDSMPTFQFLAIIHQDLAESYAEVGDLQALLHHADETVAVFDKLCKEEPANQFHRRNAWDAHHRIADLLIPCAEDEARSPDERLALWTKAHDHLQRSLAHHEAADDLVRQGREARGMIGSIRARLAECEDAIHGLDSEDVAWSHSEF